MCGLFLTVKFSCLFTVVAVLACLSSLVRPLLYRMEERWTKKKNREVQYLTNESTYARLRWSTYLLGWSSVRCSNRANTQTKNTGISTNKWTKWRNIISWTTTDDKGSHCNSKSVLDISLRVTLKNGAPSATMTLNFLLRAAFYT